MIIRPVSEYPKARQRDLPQPLQVACLIPVKLSSSHQGQSIDFGEIYDAGSQNGIVFVN
jgi:hypothetical protein